MIRKSERKSEKKKVKEKAKKETVEEGEKKFSHSHKNIHTYISHTDYIRSSHAAII